MFKDLYLIYKSWIESNMNFIILFLKLDVFGENSANLLDTLKWLSFGNLSSFKTVSKGSKIFGSY